MWPTYYNRMSFASHSYIEIWECFRIREHNNGAQKRAHVFIFRSIWNWFQWDKKRSVVDGQWYGIPVYWEWSDTKRRISLQHFARIQSRYFVFHAIRHSVSLSFIQFRMDTIKIGLNCNGFMKGKWKIHTGSEVYACPIIMCKLHILSSHTRLILRLTFLLFRRRFDHHFSGTMKDETIRMHIE